jgi:steroid 5-alpha reductase family enzyme
MLQGFMMLIISAPVIVATTFSDYDTPESMLYAGMLIWLLGYYFEVVGDHQLARFIRNKKEGKTKIKIMNTGLWRYTRHPNYFGEVTQWWGIWLIVAGLPYGWVALLSPITITTLILFVSGIPLLESKYADDKEFQKYKQVTSKFFPLPPRKI